ncbi:heme exporter protein CcmB [Bartonella tamiae]|uniref:Heme exporter protein B n=1 Tax=Bartonella tamiae Th239 TaxID=1094558 RepID=J0ZRB6_9HYPH|nr:heme exporter protein CcmB [Bartonella tamiae]EJF91233.1 heme exporter protein CcmB [Bartonella tamiae Th239]EJF93102.1 heme exporter protein CcmB [Bartonella tamiae Th307]
MKALFWRDLKMAFGPSSSLLTGLIFFAIIIIIMPFALGPDQMLLARIGPGMLWIAALLATLLGLDKLFQSDNDDGSLDILILADQHKSLSVIVFIKCAAHWCATVLPLILVTPVLCLMLHLEIKLAISIMISLLCGTPAITLIGAVGAALATVLPKGGILMSIIVLPLTVPVIIFGVSAAYAATNHDVSFINPLIFLIALSLFFSILGPFAASFALKALSE